MYDEFLEYSTNVVVCSQQNMTFMEDILAITAVFTVKTIHLVIWMGPL